MSISFGLSADDLKRRQDSIGASDARIIVNGKAEDIQTLYQQKRGELAPENLDDEIYPQFGQMVEGFHCHWFEMRTGLDITRSGEEVRHPDYPGLHVTLDGFLAELRPVEFANPKGEFNFSWGCPRPAGLVAAVFEMKWRNARQFSLEDQVATFAPQLHQGMALMETEYAVLSTLTSDLVFHARVVRFDEAYWAKCLERIEDFREAVASGRPPTLFPSLRAPKGGEAVKVVPRTVDMMRTGHANMWGAFAHLLLATAPSKADAEKASKHTKAKDQLKKLIDKDVGIATGAGIVAKRNAAGAISFTLDEKAIEAAQAATVPGADSA